MGLGKNAYAAQVQLAVTGQGFAPATRHVGNGFGCAGQRAVQRIFGAAVNDPLRLHTLAAAQAFALDHQGRKPLGTQACIEPEAGNTRADNQHVGGNNRWHGRPQRSKTRPGVYSLILNLAFSLSQLDPCCARLRPSGSCYRRGVFQWPAVLENN